MAQQFRGPAFPVDRTFGKTRWADKDLILEDHRHDERLQALKLAHSAAQDTLRTVYGDRIAAVKADPDLTRQGKDKRLQALRSEFEADLEPHVKAITDAQDWVGRARKRLTSPPDEPKNESSYAGTRRAMLEHRAVTAFAALSPTMRREALRAAREAGETDWLRALVSEPGLLTATDQAAIAADLMKQRDRGEFGQLVEMCGPLDDNGAHDVQRSALETTRYALDSAREWVAEAVGVEPTAADVLKAAGIEVGNGPAIVLDAAQAHSPQLYQAAKQVALATNRILSIRGPEGDAASVDPGDISSGNGAGGDPEAA